LGAKTLLPLSTTGIGSLPGTDRSSALAVSLAHDVPFLPELPAADEGEGLLGRGAKCLRAGAPGTPGLTAFLDALGGPRFIKLQLVGPLTLARATGKDPDVVAQALGGAAVKMIGAARSRGHEVLMVFDEPHLLRPTSALRAVLAAAKQAGAHRGIHCCGDADWGSVLEAGLDVLFIDTRLSLEAVLDARTPFDHFIEGGGALGLGLIPTSEPKVELAAACAHVKTLLERRVRGQEVLQRSLLTPACGLALHDAREAARIISELRMAQQLLER
jgi:hypothetical protein